MIFVDTSAIYALADVADPNHSRAHARFRQLLEEHEPLSTHSYVIAEAASLIQRRLGLAAALYFLAESTAVFDVHGVAETEHQRAVELLQHEGRRGLSLVDCVSFIIMRLLRIDAAFAFDADFERAGFKLYVGA